MKALKKEDLIRIIDKVINRSWIFEDDLSLYFSEYGSDFFYDGSEGAITLSKEKTIGFGENYCGEINYNKIEEWN